MSPTIFASKSKLSEIGKWVVVFELIGHVKHESDNVFSIEEVTSDFVRKISIRDVNAFIKMTEYVDIAFSDLVN